MAKPQWQETKYRRGGVMTLVSYLLTILVLWWLLRSYFVLSFSGSESAAARAVSGTREMDVVGIAVKPTCVTEFSIEKLNEFVKPRLIHVFTPTEDKCELFRRMADNVKCYTDGEVIPNVSKKSVEDFLVSTFGKTYTEYVKKSGKKLSGWYLQQFVKLGVSRYLGDRLTENFLIWDLDMILMKSIEVFTQDDPPKAMINVGGKIHIHKGYELNYENLTNRTLEIAPDGTSFVTHSLPATKRHMEELLVQFEQGEPGPWPWKILGAIDPDYIGFGFSEYASYVSWMLQNHPNQVAVKKRRTWSRYPPGASLGVAALKLISPNHLCCPTDSFLSLVKPLGYEFMGFEIGHSNLCGYHKEEHDLSYGLMKA